MAANPWADLISTNGEFLLPMDLVAVRAHNASAEERHQFRLDMVPEPYMGRLDAPVVLLTGNPRFRADDLPTHARPDVQQRLLACVRQEKLEYPVVWFDPALADTSGAKWYLQRFRAICDVVGVQAVARGIAVYESLPYHSMELKQPKTAIPSQAYTNGLARAAVDEGRLVIWQRGPWGRMLDLDLDGKPSVVRPQSLQSSYLSPKNLTLPVFDRLVDLLKNAF